MEQLAVSTLPSTLRVHLENYTRRGTVYIVNAATGVVVSSADEQKRALVIDLTTGAVLRDFERRQLSPFGGGDWRALVAEQERDIITLEPGQVLVVLATSRSNDRATVYAPKETQVQYFDLANFQLPLTWEEMHALALMGYKAFYRREAIERLRANGVNVDLGYPGLIAKGLVKQAKNGALTLTPAGQARKSERDVGAIRL
jgi:hypothetical protein